MGQDSDRKVTQDELKKLEALLEKHKIQTLITNHKPQSLSIDFDVAWLDDDAFAASFPRLKTVGPYSITLSPILLKYSLTDRVSFSTIILHELGHVVDRTSNWISYTPLDAESVATLEYKADDFVIDCGWKDNLIETLRRTIALRPDDKASDDMARKRLSRLS